MLLLLRTCFEGGFQNAWFLQWKICFRKRGTKKENPISRLRAQLLGTNAHENRTERHSLAFIKTGDYSYGTARDRVSGNLNFNGNKNYSNPVIKNTLTESNKLLSAAKKTAMGYGKSLLTDQNFLEYTK